MTRAKNGQMGWAPAAIRCYPEYTRVHSLIHPGHVGLNIGDWVAFTVRIDLIRHVWVTHTWDGLRSRTYRHESHDWGVEVELRLGS